MLFKSLTLALGTLVALARAQDITDNSTATTIGIEAIQAHFKQAGLVPDLLSTFDPSALLDASFEGVGTISPGQALQQDQVKPTPTVTITPANSSVSLGNNFTLVMVDADAVGTDESQGQTRHWLVNGVSLSGSGTNETVSTTSGVAITSYAGPAPASGSGAHRYVILLYTQPSSFTPPADLSTPNVGVSKFSLSDYVKSSGLEGPVAGTYFTVEVGTASVTPSATSPVVTSTLPVPSSTKSGSGSGTATGTGSTPSGSHTSGAVPVMQMNGVLGLVSALLAFAFF